jgi:hypothetical protein
MGSRREACSLPAMIRSYNRDIAPGSPDEETVREGRMVFGCDPRTNEWRMQTGCLGIF